METLKRQRTIRPSSRIASSPYKVDLSKRTEMQDVEVTITHENNPAFHETHHFSANQLKGRKYIHFDWADEKVIWKGVTPDKIDK